MPIRVTDVRGTETETHWTVQVPLKGARADRTDVYVNDVFVKVAYPPYLCELDLAEPVVESDCHATFEGGWVRLRLRKARPGLQGTLLWDKTGVQAAAVRERREAAAARSLALMEQVRCSPLQQECGPTRRTLGQTGAGEGGGAAEALHARAADAGGAGRAGPYRRAQAA